MSDYIGWVITNKGRELLAKVINHETKLNITKLEIGSGYNIGNDRELTALVEPRNHFLVNFYERKDNASVEFTFIVSNRATNGEALNREAYQIKEMGIFASNDAGDEVLYAYNKGANGDYLPVFNGKNQIDIIEKCIITINQQADMNVNIDNSITYVTYEGLKREFDKKISEIKTLESSVNTHDRKNIDTEEGVHGLRYYNKKLQIRKHIGDEINREAEWEKVETGDPWETNLEKLIGMPYGGTIQGASNKEAGKFYYDASTKEYYECVESNTLNYVESSKYRSMSRKNVGKGEIEAWDTTKNSKLYQKDINSPAYSAYDVGSFEIGNFIIKFGRTNSSIATQYFPTPFPNKCISVVLTPLRRVDIYTNIDVYSYNNKKFTYVGELHKINGICWVAIGY